jgi:hypothetical protein
MGAVAFVFAGTAPADPTATLYFYLFEGAGTVGGVDAIAALVGFHARQTPYYGRLGTAGFLIAFVGAVGGGFPGVLWLVCLNGCNLPIFTVTWDLSLLCGLVGALHARRGHFPGQDASTLARPVAHSQVRR